eukprot:SAG22_NODE_17066_length_312_cov_0.727700_1_plen_103_part_11
MMKVAHEVGRHAEADALRLTDKLSEVESASSASATNLNQRIAALEAAQTERERHFQTALEKSEAAFTKRIGQVNADHAAKVERLTQTFDARMDSMAAASAKAV